MSENDRAIQLPHLGSNEVRLPPEVEFTMQRAFGLSIPQTLDDVCDPARLALVVYDMQVGIVNQIENGQQIIDRVLRTAYDWALNRFYADKVVVTLPDQTKRDVSVAGAVPDHFKNYHR